MDDERIKKLAMDALCSVPTDRSTNYYPIGCAVIERAIRTALVEAFSEPATPEMQLVGYQAAANHHDQESHIYAEMCAEKRKQFAPRLPPHG